MEDKGKTGKTKILPAHIAFKLHATYGFPIELTVEICQERGILVDVEGFNKLMEAEREKSRSRSKFKKQKR